MNRVESGALREILNNRGFMEKSGEVPKAVSFNLYFPHLPQETSICGWIVLYVFPGLGMLEWEN